MTPIRVRVLDQNGDVLFEATVGEDDVSAQHNGVRMILPETATKAKANLMLEMVEVTGDE